MVQADNGSLRVNGESGADLAMPGKLEYTLSGSRFTHNLDADFAFFAVWHDARALTSRIRAHLQQHFDVLGDVEIVWSDKNFHVNAQRLYEAAIPSHVSRQEIVSGHANKIGAHHFRLFIVRDTEPAYTYCQSVSRIIELSNKNVVACKRLFRSWLNERYRVHSTNNIEEFLQQGALILGSSRLAQILQGCPLQIDHLQKDLEGADGWSSWAEIFEVIKYCSNYLVLRNFDQLPARLDDQDIDLLCDKYQRLASSLNMSQHVSRGTPYKGVIKVAASDIPTDIRFVGDGYYDAVWARQMLHTKVMRNGFFVPRRDHLFFSLLYHAKVHKPEVKDVYYGVLSGLAECMEFDWFSRKLLSNDKKAGKAIAGFLEANGFTYTRAVDPGVQANRGVIEWLPVAVYKTESASLRARVYRRAKRLVPRPVVRIVKECLRALGWRRSR